MGRIREYLPESIDDWWYEHIDEMDNMHKSYIAESLTVIPMSFCISYMIINGINAYLLIGTVLLFSLRYQSLAKIYGINMAIGEHKAEMKLKDTMTAYLRKRNIGVRFYYFCKTEDGKGAHLRFRISKNKKSGELHLKIALIIALISVMANPAWYYQLDATEIDQHRGRVLPSMAEKLYKEEVVPAPEEC